LPPVPDAKRKQSCVTDERLDMNKPTVDADDLHKANTLFTDTFVRSTKGFAFIFSFRWLARTGLERSFNFLRDDCLILFQELETNPDYKGILIDIDPNRHSSPNWARVADIAAQGQAAGFSVAVDAACLVFAHSVLDDAALQYCRVTATVSPSSWERFVIDKKIRLSEAKNETYRGLLQQNIERYLKKLEKESLLVKIDKLFAVCQPVPGYKPIRRFSYDRARLQDLDTLRHSIIHQSGPVRKLPKGEDDIRFMQLCGLYMVDLVNTRFGVQIDANQLEESFRAQQT